MMMMVAGICARDADVCVFVRVFAYCTMFNGEPVVYKWMSCTHAGPRISLAAVMRSRACRHTDTIRGYRGYNL